VRQTRAQVRSPNASTSGRPELFREYFEKSRQAPIYVILGVQGSGTNLLGRLLTKLFGFSVMRDRSAVFNAAARLGLRPTTQDVEREIERFKALVWPSSLRRKLSKHVMRKNKPMDGLAGELVATSIGSGADFARLIYTYRAFGLGASHIAIKSDDLWENIGRIDEVIPTRRIILLTRDFRDNLLSVGGKQFGPIEPVCAAKYVKNQLAFYAPEYRRAGSAGYHMTYEALLNNTRELVDDFARHFQLAPRVDLDVAVPALKFRPNKIGKWKRLPQQELSWCEGILRDELLEFGYPLATASPEVPGTAHMLLATARDKARRFPQKVRRMMARMRS
jgi:hypothetical protein